MRRRRSRGMSSKWFPASNSCLGTRKVPPPSCSSHSRGTKPSRLFIILKSSAEVEFCIVTSSSVDSGFELSMQKLCNFTKAFTNAIVRLIETPLGIAVRRTPQRWTNIPKAHSTRIRSCVQFFLTKKQLDSVQKSEKTRWKLTCEW